MTGYGGTTMILELLAALALKGFQPDVPMTAPGDNTVVVHPVAPTAVTVEVPGDDTATMNFVSIWPADAYQSRIDGNVKLNCLIDTYGLAESCTIISESPQGKGFGAAALQLRPTFKLRPVMGPNGPTTTNVTIAIGFKAPELQIADGGANAKAMPGSDAGFGGGNYGVQATGNALVRHEVTMLDHPIWAQAASYSDVVRAYPAQAGRVDGYAAIHCLVDRGGALSRCQVIKEAPERAGFGAAALSLGNRFRVASELARTSHSTPLWVDIPMRFPAPGATGERTVTPTWIVGVDPDKAPKVYPPEAAAAGVGTGRGVARCVVQLDGSLASCTPDVADPPNLGFSEAAAKLASTMKMNLWSADAAPVDGAVVRVGIRLNLKAKPAG